jgi:SAM-dependent methyltransferase
VTFPAQAGAPLALLNPLLRLSLRMQEQLRCPVCRTMLSVTSGKLFCTNAECGCCFPVIDRVPILINEKRSVFSADDFVQRRNTTFNLSQGVLEKVVVRLFNLLPSLSNAIGTKQNYAKFADLLLSQTPTPDVLVLGGSILGDGMEILVDNRQVNVLATDVSFGPLTGLICDAHDIPFADETFDGVIVQAVLEHVVDPYRCLEEIHRVLKPKGVVYAETPFMQQVHMGRYDFTRFTHSGHRRLFRRFSEIASGPVCGPGMALAWSYQYFLLSFTTSKALRAMLRVFASTTSFFLKYFDYYLINKTAAIDAASGCYFMGLKEGMVLSDRELINYYKGASN